MKFLKFLFAARISFVVFALLAFAFTVLYIGWVHQPQTPVLIHQARPATSR